MKRTDTKQPTPRRKSVRLPEEVYRTDHQPFSITIGTSPRQPVFQDLAFGRACVEELDRVRQQTGHPIFAYCLMPDHVHLLVAATEDVSLPQFIQRWKSVCYKRWREAGGERSFWQRSFYERAIRQKEDLRGVARYILMNPVRAGLVEDFLAYPLSGSFEWELDEGF